MIRSGVRPAWADAANAVLRVDECAMMRVDLESSSWWRSSDEV